MTTELDLISLAASLAFGFLAFSYVLVRQRFEERARSRRQKVRVSDRHRARRAADRRRGYQTAS
ncbi:MAG: hypothetical protein ACQGVK_15440 [Myxococcota bacterium]